MFVHLLRKELLHHLLEFRFIAVLVLSVTLSLLSVLVGQRNYHRELQEFNAVDESNRADLRKWIEEGRFNEFSSWGYRWNRPPEALSPVVYGLSGVLGQEVRLHFEYVPEFEGSPFETDALHAMFGALDFALVVKIVLSLCVLLVSYDAICGEKADGTLRLYASFPASKVSIAAAKLVGSTSAVLIPFVLSFLVVMASMVLSPETELAGEDWARLAGLMAVFALYLLVFAAFGLLVSALTHRRVSAFLGLLVVWTVWVFVLPNLAVGFARNLIPKESPYLLDRRVLELRRQVDQKVSADLDEFWKRQPIQDWDTLSQAEQQRFIEESNEVRAASLKVHDEPYQAALATFRRDRHNITQRRVDLVTALSAISPAASLNVIAMDLARTGFQQQMRIEESLSLHQVYLANYIGQKEGQRERSLNDFVPFAFKDSEKLSTVWGRNLMYVLNLALLTVLGFAGAYVAILRYDVR